MNNWEQSLVEAVKHLISPSHVKPICQFNLSSLRRTSQILEVLHCIQELQQTNRTATIRDIYYRLIHHFKNTQHLSKLIEDICVHLQCERSSLNFRVSNKGLVYGNLKIYQEDTLLIDCMACPTGQLVTDNLVDLNLKYEFGPKDILVVEKESVFSWIVEHFQLCESSSIGIVVTGKGYPDFVSRKFIKNLIQISNKEAYYLSDYDPHGIMIYLNYVIGSSGPDSVSTTISSLKWLGIHAGDIAKLPDKVFAECTDTEKSMLSNIIKQDSIKQLPLIKKEMDLMLLHNKKCEVEASHYKKNIYIDKN